MNRQIKFRGLRLDNKEWIYGGLFEVEGNSFIIDTIKIIKRISGYPPICDVEQVDPATVGQFTGLLNKYGKEIYQHDWLAHPYEGHIDWCDKCKQFQLHWPEFGCANCCGEVNWPELIDDPNLEVIGNIHENPEFLEKGVQNTND